MRGNAALLLLIEAEITHSILASVVLLILMNRLV